LATLVLAAGLLVTTTSLADEPAQAARIEVGQEAPGFSLTATDGGQLTLSDLRGEKDLVLVFFRAHW
jgi:cytochrome oxidase Cu insertion factor (SCO1/SenC/PrrC family)